MYTCNQAVGISLDYTVESNMRWRYLSMTYLQAIR